MRRIIFCGAAIATLTTFGGQSAGKKQPQALRQSLRQIVDEVEALRREEITLLRELIAVETRNSFRYRRRVVSAERNLAKTLAELRQDIKEYPDAELPMLDLGVRWERTEAKSAVKVLKESLEWEQQGRPSTAVSLEPPATPPPPDWPLEEIRQGLSKRIDKIEETHQKTIAKLQALQAGQSSQRQKREARTVVKATQGNQRHEMLFLRNRLRSAKDHDLGKIERAISSAERQAKGRLEEGLRLMLKLTQKKTPQ